MDIALYSTISWLIVAFYFMNERKHEKMKGVIIYLAMLVIIGSACAILTLNLQLVHITDSFVNHAALFLHRDFVMPFLFVIYIERYNLMTKPVYKVMLSLFLMFVFSLLEIFNVSYGLCQYIRWSFANTFILFAVFIIMALLLNKFIDLIQQKGERDN